MKRLFCFLLCSFLFVSASFGADRCSAPDKTYDADKRCYVSRELFTKTPYNAAAHLLFSPVIQEYYCSGVAPCKKKILAGEVLVGHHFATRPGNNIQFVC